jgi:flagellar FliJ protein
MTNKLESLDLLLEREQRRRDDARAGVLKAVRNEEAAREQLDGLTTYRSDYCKRWTAQFSKAATMDIVRCYQAFVARLDQAISQQQGMVRSAQAGIENARKRLVEREVRLATVQRLIERRREQFARAENRVAQRNLDELAQRRSPAAEFAGLR